MRILFIGDIVGRPGRIALKRWLPKLRRELSIDIVVVNAENAAGGLGVTPEILDELFQQGVQAVTLGNHTWRKKALIAAIDNYVNVLRPLNFPKGSPGRGSAVIPLDDGRKLGLVNAIGRIYMEPCDCPFEKTEEAVEELRKETHTILVDMHAEATSEKSALGWFLDGRCTAVVGTHTHVQTADERVLPGGTAYISDVGMTGPRDSVIGVEREIVIYKFRTGLPASFDVAKEPAMVNGVVIESSDETGKAVSIERVYRL
jgi:hypothetical protein